MTLNFEIWTHSTNVNSPFHANSKLPDEDDGLERNENIVYHTIKHVNL